MRNVQDVLMSCAVGTGHIRMKMNTGYGHSSIHGAQLALGQQWKSWKRITRNQVRGRKRDKVKKRQTESANVVLYVEDVYKTWNK